jgi:hypothetical protein
MRKRKNKKASSSAASATPPEISLPPQVTAHIPKSENEWSVRDGVGILLDTPSESEARSYYNAKVSGELGQIGLWRNNAPYESHTFIP